MGDTFTSSQGGERSCRRVMHDAWVTRFAVRPSPYPSSSHRWPAARRVTQTATDGLRAKGLHGRKSQEGCSRHTHGGAAIPFLSRQRTNVAQLRR
jgi:hypothetical protein